MKKLSEFHGDAALDVIGDILEPAAIIFSDTAVKKALKDGSKAETAAIACHKHKPEIFEIMAVLSECTVEEYKQKCNPLSIVADVIAVLNDRDAMSVFSSVGQSVEQ